MGGTDEHGPLPFPRESLWERGLQAADFHTRQRRLSDKERSGHTLCQVLAQAQNVSDPPEGSQHGMGCAGQTGWLGSLPGVGSTWGYWSLLLAASFSWAQGRVGGAGVWLG